jgi:hypothetical protein
MQADREQVSFTLYLAYKSQMQALGLNGNICGLVTGTIIVLLWREVHSETSCPIVTGGSVLGVKAAGAWRKKNK